MAPAPATNSWKPSAKCCELLRESSWKIPAGAGGGFHGNHQRIETDTLGDLRKKARLLSVAIDGLYAQVSGDRIGDVEETFLPVQALAGEVDDLVQQIYSADGEPETKELARAT